LTAGDKSRLLSELDKYDLQIPDKTITELKTEDYIRVVDGLLLL
jgi:hypothetical protein